MKHVLCDERGQARPRITRGARPIAGPVEGSARAHAACQPLVGQRATAELTSVIVQMGTRHALDVGEPPQVNPHRHAERHRITLR